MKKRISLYVRSVLTFLRIVITKIFNIKGPNVLIYDHDHDISSAESIHDSGYKTSPVVIGDDVWIGANTVILRGTVIGRDCVVGAGSVLKGVYPAGSVIVQKRTENIYEKGRVSG